MIGYASFIFCVVSLSCVQAQESAEPAVDPYLSLTAFEFLRRGNPFLLSPLSHLQWTRPRNEIETNEIDTGDGDRVPVLQFRRYDAPLRTQWTPPGAPELEVVERKKREADKQETVLIGKIRNKRTYCRKCYSKVSYVPVYVQPSYIGSGCNTCGGGGFGGGGFGGYAGGSFSSSSSQSSSSSFGYGK